MRVINTTTLERQLLQAEELERLGYAILSHRWLEKGELTYSDYSFERLKKDETSEALFKIRGACKAAQFYGIDWIWIDNVCIDKTSSAELTESINSMFRWYRQAKVCIVYLGDTIGSLSSSSG